MTKRIFMLLAVVLLSSASMFAQSNEPLKGDVNGDGVVDVADVVAVIDIIAKSQNNSETTYYWYVGSEQPTALPLNDSDLATGTNSGWRKIGNSKPTAGTVIWDGETGITISSSKVTQYFAINSDVTIGSYDSFGVDQTSSFLTGPTISNGMNIYTSVSKSKTFDQIIKVK